MDPLLAKTVAAGTGATITALTMTPFDVVKTRMQTQIQTPPLAKQAADACCQPTGVSCVRRMSSLARPASGDVVCLWEDGILKSERVNGFWDAVLRVSRTEGVRGLWKGAGTTLAMAVPASTAYMVTYDHLLNVTVPPISPSPALTPLISGIISRTLISSICSPLELLRTNLQSTPISVSQPHSLRSVVDDLSSLVRSQGVRALWRGLGPTLWRDVPFSGLYWANYEVWRKQFELRGYRGPTAAFISGAISGMTAAFLTSPFDVIKTRRQALLMSNRQHSSSSFLLIKQILKTEGVGALFAGLSPRIAKIAPACGIMIACFEGVGKALVRPHPAEL